MALVHDALHDLWGILRKVARTEEGSLNALFLQYVKDTVGAYLTDRHTLFQREVHTMFTGHIKFFGIETE
jgi:hypothetical protein